MDRRCKECKHYLKIGLGFGRCCPPLPKWLSDRFSWYQIWPGRDHANCCATFEQKGPDLSLPETDQDIPIPKAKPPKPEFAAIEGR